MKYGMVFNKFSVMFKHWGWRKVEEIYNPNLAFDEVHLISFNDAYDYSNVPLGSLKVHPIKPIPRIIRYLFTPLFYSLIITRKAIKVIKENRLPLIGTPWICGDPLEHGLPAVLSAWRSGIPSFISLASDYEKAFRMMPRYLRIPFLNAWGLTK